jgi:SAM-dependent methyltransferase
MSTPNREKYALKACRACNGPLRKFLDLGDSPVANRLLSDPLETVETYPLGLSRCMSCTLVQNATSLPGDLLFGADYAYMSSVSSAVKTNARALAQRVAHRLDHNAMVLDVGSNDGTLQRAFSEQGLTCIGVDPSQIPVDYARATGMTSYCAPFDKNAAQDLTQKHGRFDAITMSNVLAHVAAPQEMLEAARQLLDPENGLLVIEFQSWEQLVKLGAFDMVYHEHHSHFSLGSAATLLGANGFSIFDVQNTNAQGGSLQLWCRPSGDHASPVNALITVEAATLHTDESDLNLALETCRKSALRFLQMMQTRKVVGYGAAAKTVTLLAALKSGLGIRCVGDKAETKITKFLPYGAIPILSPSQMLETNPDAILIFAWNLAEEILPELQGREAWVPFPEFKRVQ